MDIVDLASQPEHIAELAALHEEAWGYLVPDSSVEKRIQQLKNACEDGAIPSMYIATDEQTLVGSAALIEFDMRTRKDLTPWLAAVYVKAAYRRRGIGTALVARVEAQAAELGIETLYLYTPSAAGLYRKLGWELFERCKYMDTNVDIMHKTLSA